MEHLTLAAAYSGKSLESAILNLFKEERGQHFDPYLVDIFFDSLAEILQVREVYKDDFIGD